MAKNIVRLLSVYALLVFIGIAPLIAASPDNCNQKAQKAVVYLDLPGRPFEPVPSQDGCWIFVSMAGGPMAKAGIGVIRRSEGKLSLKRVIPTTDLLTGMTLTHDGKLLIVGIGNGVIFLDVEFLISGSSNPILGKITTSSRKPSASYLSVTSDDRYLFVSNESAGTISVIALGAQKALVGNIPVGRAPIAVTISPDDRYLYSTSEVAPATYGWPNACEAEQTGGIRHQYGVIMVVDVSRAKTDPANSVVAKTAAGCSPVRLVLSPDSTKAYVTARSDNALLTFDTAKLLSDPEHAKVGTVSVGQAPVGVAVIDGGRKIVVANSNRFSHDEKNQTLSVISSSNHLVGSIPAEVFPRELRVTEDARTLLVTNFSSKTLELVDLNSLSFLLEQ